MVIIFGVSLQTDKKIRYALPALFGLGLKKAKMICEELSFAPELKVKDLTEQQQFELAKKIKEEHKIENNLKEEIKNRIQSYITNGSIRGFRHKYRLPVRGQRTHSNARTAKRVIMGIALKQKK